MSPQPPLPTDPRPALRALLRLYADWGVDCALDAMPHDRAIPAGAGPDRVILDGARRKPMPDARPGEVPGNGSGDAPGRGLGSGVRPETRRASGTTSDTRAGNRPLSSSDAGVRPAAPSPAADLPALIAQIETLPNMPLRRTATHTLVPVAVPGSALMILGDIPDSDEDRTGALFAGSAGALLGRMLGSIGLAPDALSRSAAIPWRPPGGRDATDLERATCVPLLQRAIVLCAPRIVASFGPTPARMLLGADTQLNRVRGRWATLDLPGAPHPIRLLPMRHPAQVAASPQARKDAWRDLIALAEALETESRPGP